MATLEGVEDQRIRKHMAELRLLVNSVRTGRRNYVPNHFIKSRDRINKAFERYIKRKRKELGEVAEDYGFTKRDLRKYFETEERILITTFQRNVLRAFGQAMHAIERALGEQLTAPGRFGIFGLLSKLRKRPKLEETVRVEGLTRLTRRGTLFTINLIDYLIMLLKTAQMEWDRKLNTVLAFRARVDLVRISPQPCWLGPAADEVCNRWRDKIVSLTGFTENFPKLDDALAERPPLFHPNCRHSMIPLTKREERIAKSRNIRFYNTLRRYL